MENDVLTFEGTLNINHGTYDDWPASKFGVQVFSIVGPDEDVTIVDSLEDADWEETLTFMYVPLNGVPDEEPVRTLSETCAIDGVESEDDPTEDPDTTNCPWENRLDQWVTDELTQWTAVSTRPLSTYYDIKDFASLQMLAGYVVQDQANEEDFDSNLPQDMFDGEAG